MARLLSLLALAGTAFASVCRHGSSPPCGPNVVNQGMFAAGGGPPEESGWTVTGGEAYVPSICNSDTITSCLVFYQDATLVQTGIPTTPGGTYAFSFSIMSGRDTFPVATCGPIDDQGQFVVANGVTSSLDAKQVWEDFKGSFVATDSTTSFMCQITVPSGMVAIFSNIQISLNCIAPPKTVKPVSSVSSVSSASSISSPSVSPSSSSSSASSASPISTVEAPATDG